jgi:DNA-binding NtrC family response regulator
MDDKRETVDTEADASLEGLRRQYIRYALEATGHDQVATARLLAISVRELQRFMRRLSLA